MQYFTTLQQFLEHSLDRMLNHFLYLEEEERELLPSLTHAQRSNHFDETKMVKNVYSFLLLLLLLLLLFTD